jgi:hypothetical protein
MRHVLYLRACLGVMIMAAGTAISAGIPSYAALTAGKDNPESIPLGDLALSFYTDIAAQRTKFTPGMDGAMDKVRVTLGVDNVRAQRVVEFSQTVMDGWQIHSRRAINSIICEDAANLTSLKRVADALDKLDASDAAYRREIELEAVEALGEETKAKLDVYLEKLRMQSTAYKVIDHYESLVARHRLPAEVVAQYCPSKE